MRALIVHQNFPGQFGPILRTLRSAGNVEVAGIGQRLRAPSDVRYHRYEVGPLPTGLEKSVATLAYRAATAKAVAEQATQLKQSGFIPDIILAHPGWGEGLYLKDVFPRSRLICYCEYYYHRDSDDLSFDPEFAIHDPIKLHQMRGANAFTLATLEEADLGVAPTRWQRATFPDPLQSKIEVLHEGVSDDCLTSTAAMPMRFERSAAALLPGEPIVTFVARTLEPYRGFHVLMRALPELFARVPRAQVLFVGKASGGYGAQAPSGRSWRDLFLAEVSSHIDVKRVHFAGWLPRNAYLNALRLSRAHAYLTYPYVLSWSLLEAMAMGCVVAASDTAPVREFCEDNRNARLVPFFDRLGWASTLGELLEDDGRSAPLRRGAQRTIVERGLTQRSTSRAWLSLMRDLGGSAC